MGYEYVSDNGPDSEGGGQWSPDEQKLHINCKGLQAARFGLKALCKDITDAYVRIMTDNQTTVPYIREMGAANHSKPMIWAETSGFGPTYEGSGSR